MGEGKASYSEFAETRRTGGGAEISQRPMTRVRLTPDDLARTRLSQAPAPLVETVLGLARLRRDPLSELSGSREPSGSWVRQARQAFPATARPLLDLVPSSPPWPAFFDQLAADPEEGLEMVHATPRHVLCADLAASWHGAGRPPLWLRNLADGEPEAGKHCGERCGTSIVRALLLTGHLSRRRSGATCPSGFPCSLPAAWRRSSAL